MKLEEVQFKLLSEIQSLPSEISLELCNRAIKEIRDEYDWSFLYKKDYLRTPALINTGTININKFSNSVVVSADLKVIIDAISINDVPIIGRQLKVFGGQIAGSQFIYTITGYDSGTSTLIIDPFYQDQDNSAASFQIFKNLYTAPESIERDSDNNITFQGIDFANFEYIYAPFVRRKLILDRNRSQLDRLDYNRESQGDPIWLVSSGQQDSAGNQLFELYPIPTSERVYQVLYKTEGRYLEQDDNIPPIDYNLIICKAKMKAYEWMMINGDIVNNKRNPNLFANSIAMLSNPNLENSYPKLLEKAKMKDENLFPQALIDLGNSVPYYEDVIVETILIDF